MKVNKPKALGRGARLANANTTSLCSDHFIVNKSPALGKGARPVVAGKTGISGREAMWEFSSSLIP